MAKSFKNLEQKRNIALIPARGQSKRIARKNLLNFFGYPLIAYSIHPCLECKDLEETWVSTEDEEIKNKALDLNAKVHDRPPELALDHISTEEVMLDFANKVHFDNLILIQPTSPYIKKENISEALKLMREGNYDSVISVVGFKKFLWKDSRDGAIPITHSEGRIFTQNMNGQSYPYFTENGAMYITSRESLINNKNRYGKRIGLYIMDERFNLELDYKEDIFPMRELIKKLIAEKYWG